MIDGTTDIDIDFADRQQALELSKHVPPKLKNRKHNMCLSPSNQTVYVCTVEHNEADDMDFFNWSVELSIYKDVADDKHLTQLMEREPIMGTSGGQRLSAIQAGTTVHWNNWSPSLEQLASTLAIIRPAKRHLQDKGWPTIMKEVWKKPVNDNKAYYFKKAHAVSYAMVVVVHMNLLCEQLGQ